jgi:AraC-like DNA-binding protein
MIGREISVLMTAILLYICLYRLLRYLETRKPGYQLSLLLLGLEKNNDLQDADQEMKRDAGKITVELPATAGLSALFYMTEEDPAEQEDDFLTRLRKVLDENMSDSDFDIPQLCRVLCVSTSQLHQKVKRFTGKSTSIYIRCLRLEKAKSLLTEQDWKISEIAYEVGFKNPTYFTQAFTQEFGVSPSSFRNQ